jgi:hypothetical protein
MGIVMLVFVRVILCKLGLVMGMYCLWMMDLMVIVVIIIIFTICYSLCIY